MEKYFGKIAFIFLSFFVFYWSYIVIKINDNIGDILPVIIIIFPISLLFGCIIFLIEKRRKKEIKKIATAILLVCFLSLFIIKCIVG